MTIKRTMYLDKLSMYLNRDVVKVITGVRRSGKTTILKQFVELMKDEGIPEENIVYLNFESIIYSHFNRAAQLRDMLIEFVHAAPGRTYIILDEPGNIEGWAEVASEMMNLHDCDIYVSSSNASVFNEEFRKMLGFRYVRIDVFPLSFGEYLELVRDLPYGHTDTEGGLSDLSGAKDDGTPTPEEAAAAQKIEAEMAAYIGSGPVDREKTPDEAHGDRADEDEVMQPSAAAVKREHFLNYLQTGFMPGTYLIGDPQARNDYLIGLFNTIILNDAVKCNKLRDIGHIEKILEFILTHMSETFSPKAIRDYVRQRGTTISVDTVYSVLNALTGAYLLYKIPRYDIKAERVLDTQEKYYFCDPAIAGALLGEEALSLETRLENAVALEMLSRGFKLYVGKSGQTTIDFMAARGADRTYLNVCESVADKASVRKEFGSLGRIRDNYFKMVLSLDESTIVNKGGIINYPITDFLSKS